jgi:excinuclease ABC subunit C
LLQLARQNAEVAFARRGQKEQDWEKTLTELQQHLKLKNHPHRIECYDISNFQGQASMGSMVTFLNGGAEPKLYRHFKIKTVTGSDDFASLYEVLYRRIRKSREAGGEAGDSPWALPDLVVIDGGKGQLHAVHQAFKDLGVEGVDLISLAKSRLQATDSPVKQRSEERVFLLGRKDPVFFPKNSSILFLLVRLRDEAHRFGIESHRKYLKRSALYSALDAVEGVGKVRRQRLLKNFGSLKGIKAAATDAVARVIGASEDMAKRIQESL